MGKKLENLERRKERQLRAHLMLVPDSAGLTPFFQHRSHEKPSVPCETGGGDACSPVSIQANPFCTAPLPSLPSEALNIPYLEVDFFWFSFSRLFFKLSLGPFCFLIQYLNCTLFNRIVAFIYIVNLSGYIPGSVKNPALPICKMTVYSLQIKH